MARVLWMGDAGCHTGFARVTHSIGERLALEYGHQITVLASNHSGDYWPGQKDPDHQPLRMYAASGMRLDRDPWGSRRVLEMLYKVRPEVVVMLNDPGVLLTLLLNNPADPNRVLMQHSPIISYVPCDGVNLPPDWTTLVPQLTDVLVMSKWGQQHYSPSQVVYHGVEPDQWWPVEEKPITTSSGEVLRDKEDCKRAFGYSASDFLVGRIDTNSGRKDFGATWAALVPAMKKHKNIKAHFHCSNRENPAIKFPALFSREPEVADRFYTPAMKTDYEGWPQQDMNALVNAFDVVMTTSRGEGFGLTIAEAVACGVPVIAQNVSAIPEVVGPGGVLIEPQRLLAHPGGQDNWLANVPAFTEALLDLYDNEPKRQDLGIKGTQHARANFSWDVAASIFDIHIRNNVAAYEAFVAAKQAEAAGSPATGEVNA